MTIESIPAVRRMAGWKRALALALLCASTSALPQVSVTEGGQSSYAVPVAVPPGRGGVEPKLSLQFSSGAQSGPFGHGWSLGGLSVITRCGSVIDTDGVRRGVRYTADDKLCLDGQRLILTDTSGVPVTGQTGYGSAGTEYRLEKDNDSRVRAYGGTSTTGPQSFKVWTKSGLIYEYGANTDSRIEAQGKTAVMAWAVSKVSDTVGNFMTLTYSKWSNSFAGSSGSEWAIQQIRYTGNGAQAPTQRVDFAYETRPDKSEAYHEGSKSVNTLRLTAIRTYTGTAADGTGGIKVGTLKLGYTTGPQTGRSLVSWTQSCGGEAETVCSPKTEFTYNTGPGFTFEQVSHSSLTGIQLKNSTGTLGVLQGDFNGDGRQDLIRWSDSPSSNELLLSNGDGSFTLWTSFNLKSVQLGSSTGCYYSQVADFNLDGVADILQVSDPYNNVNATCGNGSWAKLYLGSTTGEFGTAINVTSPLLVKSVPLIQSVCFSENEGGCASAGDVLVRRGANFQLADVNGDGAPDVILSNTEARYWGYSNYWGSYPDVPSGCSERTCIYLGSVTSAGTFTKLSTSLASEDTFSSPSNQVPLGFFSNPGAYKTDDAFVGDFNGDGLPDIVARRQGVRYIATGTVGNFTKYTSTVPACPSGLEILDINGDGKWDLACLQYDDQAAYKAWFNDGAGGFAYRGGIAGWTGGSPPICRDAELGDIPCPPSDYRSYVQYVAADFDGDGISDLLAVRRKLEWGQVDSGVYTSLAKGNRDGSFSAASTSLATVPLLWQDAHAFVLGDFTGKGTMDILRMSDSAGSNAIFRRANAQPADLLVNVKAPSGAQTAINYKPLTDASVYTRTTGATYPTIDLVSTQWVVSSVDAPSGVGGIISTAYEYGGQRAHINGRGYLGFRTLSRTAPAADGTPVTTRTTYRQDFPFVGLPHETRKWPQAAGASAWVSLSESAYGDLHPTTCPLSVPSGTPRLYRPVVQTNTEQSRDLNLTPLATVLTTHGSYTCHGDPLQVTLQTTGVVQGQARTYTKTTTNQYLAANTAGDNWILGRLTRTDVSNVVPDLLLASSSGGAPVTFNGLALSVSTASVVQSRSTPGLLTADITPTATGGSPGYTYSWTRLTGSTFTMSTASNGVLTVTGNLTWNQNITETFRVTATDQDNATRTQDISVSYSVGAPPPLTATLSTATATGTRNNAGVINITNAGVTAAGGSGTYTYNWVRINGTKTSITNPTSAMPTFSATMTGLGQDFTEIVRVTVTDSLGATTTKDLNVRFYTPTAPTASINLLSAGGYPPTYVYVYNNSLVTAPTCPSPYVVSTNVSVSGGVPPYTYQWSASGASVSPATGSSSITLYVPSPLYGGGNYQSVSVTVTDSVGNSGSNTRSYQVWVDDRCWPADGG